MRTITHAGRAWHFSHALGQDSVTRGLRYPCSVAFATDGAIWVLSRGMVVRPLAKDITVAHQPKIGKWSVADGVQIGDFARNEFTWPTALASDSDGNLYCCDEYENFIAVFGPDGPYYELPKYDPSGEALRKWGEKGPLPGQLDGPSGMAFDLNDDLYVVDSGNHRVQKFTKDGRHLDAWGSQGSGYGQFESPWGIALDARGDVYVADWGNSRVQSFSSDGQYITSYGDSSSDDDPLYHPSDVAVDGDGDVYVADWGNKRVQIFEPDGDVIGAIHGDATEFLGPVKAQIDENEEYTKAYRRTGDLTQLGRFDRPIGVQVNAQDRLFVVDSRRGRVQIYDKDKDYEDIRLTV